MGREAFVEYQITGLRRSCGPLLTSSFPGDFNFLSYGVRDSAAPQPRRAFGISPLGRGVESNWSTPHQTKLHACIFYEEFATLARRSWKGPRALLRELGNSLGSRLVEIATTAKSSAFML